MQSLLHNNLTSRRYHNSICIKFDLPSSLNLLNGSRRSINLNSVMQLTHSETLIQDSRTVVRLIGLYPLFTDRESLTVPIELVKLI